MSKRNSVWTILTIGFAVICGATGTQAAETGPAADDPSWSLCIEAANKLEKEYGIPDHLLSAVTLTETGRRGPDRQLASWPWTVHDGTRGYHLNTREEAIALVRELREGGRRSVDIGCMQVNLRHHPRAFTSIEDGFDPETNMRYAAEFLSRLNQVQNSWEEAVARYHSYNPEFYKLYATKVMGHWQTEKRKAAAASAKPAKNAKLDKSAALETSPLDRAASLIAGAAVATPRPAPNRSEAEIILASAEARAARRAQPAVNRSAVVPPSSETQPAAAGASLAASDELDATDDMGGFFQRTFGWPN